MGKDKDILKSSIVQGFGTLIAREFFLKLISFAGQIFLARLLIPSDFGIYVIIVFVISVFSLFTDVGLSLAIIQKHKEPTKTELSTVFFIKIFLTVFIISLIWLFAPFIKFIYPTFTENNVLMLRIFSLTLLLTNMRTIPISLLERKIKYNLISLMDVIGVFIYYTVSLLGAFKHYGPWSFIFGAISKEIGETLVLYYIQPFIPNFTFSKKSIKNMIKFGVYVQGNALINVLETSIIPVIGGRLSGIYSVGLLDFSYNIASMPEIIAVNFGRVAFASYSRIQKEKKMLFSSISKSISMLSILLYIFPVIIFGLGKELVPVIFSAKWTLAIPALYWYSASTILLPFIAPLGQGILVIGKSKEIFWTSLITVLLGIIGTFALIGVVGFVGVAIGYFLIILTFCLFYIQIFKKAGYAFPVISIIFPKLLVVILSLILITIMNAILPQVFIILILKLFVAILIYIIFMFLIIRKDALEFIKLISHWTRPKLS